jgi:transcriptional regulator with GAF, ATPase, and Fis domain
VDDPARFEAFLLDLAERFTGMPIAQIDEAIGQTLRRIGEAMMTDRATMLEFAPGVAHGRVTHSWARPGFEHMPAGMDAERAFPWSIARVSRGETVALEHLPADLPAEAGIEREYVRATGFKSVLTVPVAIGGQIVCALSTGTFRLYHAWPASLIARFRVTGQILASAIARKRAEEHLQQRFEEIAERKTRLESENAHLRKEIRRIEKMPTSPLRALDDVERDHVRAVLECCGWKINGPGHAAEILGLHPNTLRFRMKKLGLARPKGTAKRS